MPDRSTSDTPGATVYRLEPECTVEDIEEGHYYHATVDALVDYGMFVELASSVSGLVHESNYHRDYDPGDDLVVELTAIKENGDLSFVPANDFDYQTVAVEHTYDTTPIAQLADRVGDRLHLEGELVQIKQTGGPTLLHVSDGTGVVPCAAFEAPGVRAHPDLENGDIVHVDGRVERRDTGLQIEVDGIVELDPPGARTVRDTIAGRLTDHAAPHEIDPLVDWPALAALFPQLEQVAEQLRRAALENRPIVIRHHADTDGMCASVPIEYALERFIAASHADADATQHLLKRLPSRAPYYEMEDVTRDLNHALSNRARHGQKLPVFVMIDNGSTAEDVPAYQQLDTYDISVVVIDHHHPDHEAVEPYVDAHVNPYRSGTDYRITAGMMCVELARMIDPDITQALRHIPAIAGLADRSAADAMDDYLELARDAGYDPDMLRDVGDALDYTAYWLRYGDGRGLTNDLLNLPASNRHVELVRLLAGRADRDIERQLDDAQSHVEVERLANDVRCYRVDVERYAHRFTYPAPGTTTGAIHDRMVRERGEPAVTIGVGPDFAVLRSDGVRLDIPEMVSELNDQFAGAGVSGGGHLVVGSIRFVKGMREPVLSALIEKIAMAEIDESLGATAPRAYGTDRDR